MFDAATIRRRFGRAADGYAEHARLQAEVAGRLLERLEGLRFEPSIIVDLGSGPGLQARLLAERYPAARVVALAPAVPASLPRRLGATWSE